MKCGERRTVLGSCGTAPLQSAEVAMSRFGCIWHVAKALMLCNAVTPRQPANGCVDVGQGRFIA